MELKMTQAEPGISVMTLAGRITAGESLTEFRNLIRDEVAKGHNKIVIDLKEVSYIDSSGLGELVLALGTITQTICASCGSTLFKDDQGEWERCRQCNGSSRKSWGQLKLSSPGRQVTDLLHFTKLISVFDVHDNQADAIASFS
jgi:anti-sigma B factor antagonist